MTKKIGLPFWKIGDNSFGASLPYIEFASRFGEVIPLMPNHTIREDLDLLILPGGPDVDTARYGQIPEFNTGKPDIFKESFDINYLPSYIDTGVPIFGICRAHQSIAVHFKAGLIQHMYHETNELPSDPTGIMHSVTINRQLPKLNIKAGSRINVNSRHHQVVSKVVLPEELKVIATYNGKFGDNCIEALAHIDKPIVTVQWHPEDVYDQNENVFIHSIINHLMLTRKSIL